MTVVGEVTWPVVIPEGKQNREGAENLFYKITVQNINI